MAVTTSSVQPVPSTLDPGQVLTLEQLVGVPPKQQAIGLAIAEAESGGNPSAVNVNKNGSIDTGLWQINSVHYSSHELDPRDVFTPIGQARDMYKISKGGTDWNAWTSYSYQTKPDGSQIYVGPGQGDYKKFLPLANTYVAAGEAYVPPKEDQTKNQPKSGSNWWDNLWGNPDKKPIQDFLGGGLFGNGTPTPPGETPTLSGTSVWVILGVILVIVLILRR